MSGLLQGFGRFALALAGVISATSRVLGAPSRAANAVERRPAPERPRQRSGGRRRLAVVATTGAAALVVAVVGAIAYWTTSGSGTATASAGTLTAATISASTTTGSVTVTWDTQAAMTPASQNSAITYTVERKLGAGSFAVVASGPCSGSLAYNTASCTDALSVSGSYTYRVVADYANAWTASSNEVTLSVITDADAPTTTTTFPLDTGVYNAVSYAAGCTPTGLCGTATDATGVDTVRVSIRRLSDGAYWTGSAYSGFSEFFLDASLFSPGATSTSWGFALPLPGDGQYTLNVQAKDVVGNDSAPSYTSTATFTIDASAPTQVVSMTTPVNAFLGGSTVYYRGTETGSFKLADAVTDAGTGPASATFPAIGAAGWTHAAETVTTGTGSNPTKTYTSSTYSWTASPSNPSTHDVTGADGAGNTVDTALTFANDSAPPTGGALTVNGGVASGAGTTTYYGAPSTISYAIARTDFTDAGSGLASSSLTREEATLSSSGLPDGTCGAYGAPTPISGAPTQNASVSVTTAHCYRYTLTGTDNVGNTVSISTVVKVDTTAPSAPVLALSAATGNTFISGTTAFVNSQAGKSGGFTVTATTTDTQSGIQKVGFPAPTDFTGGGDDTTSPYAATYGWSGAAGASGAQPVTSFNNAGVTAATSFTITPDTATPTGGVLTVNSGNAYATTTSVTVARTNYADAGSGLAAGSNTITRTSAALTNNTCGAPFTGPVTVTPGSNTVASGNCYLYVLDATDNVGNSVSVSFTLKVDTSQPATFTPALSNATGNTFINGSTVYTNPQAGKSGGFDVVAAPTDPESGIQKVTFPSPTGFSSGGGDDTTSPYATTYAWSGAGATASGSQTVVATNNALLTRSGTNFTITPDTADPTGGALTVNGIAATAGGSTSGNFAGSFTIGTRTAHADGVSGLASSTLIREEADLSGGTCDTTWTNATTITGTPTQNAGAGIATGNCYRYTYTGVDNVGNDTTVVTIVKVDTSAPTFGSPALTLSTTGSFAFYPGSGLTVYYNGGTGTSSSIVVTAPNVADTESAIQNVIFPTISGFTGGVTDTTSPFGTTYTWSSSSANGAQNVTVTNGVSNTATLTMASTLTLARDATAPTGGAVTVNGQAASGPGTTSNNTTGSFTISGRADYTETQSPSAAGLLSSALVRDQATLNADFTCGTFGSPTTIVGTPAQSGLSNATCYRYTLTGTDNVSNTASVNTTVKVDTVSPTATNVQLTGNGGSATNGDTVVITYSELMDVSTFCAAWANDGNDKAIDGNGEATATITNAGTNDVLTVSTAGSVGCTGGFKLGSISLGGDYVSGTRTFSGSGSSTTDIVWDVSSRTLTIELGTQSGGAVNTGILAGTPSYTADTALKDRAGGTMGAGPYTGSPASRF